MSNRSSLFISHGNPEDNEFVGWLAARLIAAGYKVWIDLWHGKGHPTWEEIEEEIRMRAKRVIALVSSKGVVKPGFKDEINAAQGVARDLSEPGFIIPIRLDDISFRTQVPIQLGRLNFIDRYQRGWDEALADLLAQLATDKVDRIAVSSAELFDTWIARRKAATELVSRNPERVLTNWFQIDSFPEKIYFYASDSLHSAWGDGRNQSEAPQPIPGGNPLYFWPT